MPFVLQINAVVDNTRQVSDSEETTNNDAEQIGTGDTAEEKAEEPIFAETAKRRKLFVAPKSTPKKSKEDPRVTEAYSVLSSLKQKMFENPRDDCCVYGEHIALKLRSCDTMTRAIVQHHMNNILFNADMGQYAQFYHHQRSSPASSYEVLSQSTTPSPAPSVPSERNLQGQIPIEME